MVAVVALAVPLDSETEIAALKGKGPSALADANKHRAATDIKVFMVVVVLIFC
jgi:hypothetical protein